MMPSVGSSSSKSFRLRDQQRAMASCCCSPPEACARLVAALLQDRKALVDVLQSASAGARGARCTGSRAS